VIGTRAENPAAMEAFTTARLALRAYDESDLAALIDLHARPEGTRLFGLDSIARDEADARRRLALIAQRYRGEAPLPYGLWAVTGPEGRLVGTAVLGPAPDAEQRSTEEIEIGWHLHPDARGRGLATELARALVDRFFGRTEGAQLIALVDPSDERSAAVARRAGLVYAGSTERFHGRHLRRYAIDRAAWERRSQRRGWSVAIFARHEGRVLLVKHKRLGTWLPVGGEVEAGETPLEAARRELLEETGLEGLFPEVETLEGAPPGLLGYEEHLAGKKGLHLNLSFVVDVETRAVVLDDSLAGHVWASLDDGPWSEAPPNVRQLAERALAAPRPCP
jgi:RimJ/RimL family protein N-acetyltransferase/8-oxo-dGTP pyrophosphatase MutT (NUDIX family)